MKVKELTEVLNNLPQENEAELIVIDENKIIYPKIIQTLIRSDGVIKIVLISNDEKDN